MVFFFGRATPYPSKCMQQGLESCAACNEPRGVACRFGHVVLHAVRGLWHNSLGGLRYLAGTFPLCVMGNLSSCELKKAILYVTVSVCGSNGYAPQGFSSKDVARSMPRGLLIYIASSQCPLIHVLAHANPYGTYSKNN